MKLVQATEMEELDESLELLHVVLLNFLDLVYTLLRLQLARGLV